MLNRIYNLPELNFIGGDSKRIRFTLHTPVGEDFDASKCELGFAIINYANRNGIPAVLKKDIPLEYGESGVKNVVVVNLESDDTKLLYGKYIYQLTIKYNNETDIPGQGIMNITRNIHTSFLN